MNAIRSLWNALGNLANAINGLAATVDTASGRLRQQLADGEGPAILEHQAAGGDGEHAGNGKGRKSRAGA